MKRKIIGLLLCFVCAFAFCGCAPEPTPPQTPTEPTQPTTPTEPTTPTDTGMTLDTLLRDHAAKAKTFFETYLRPSAVGQREVKSETAYLVENDSKQIVKAQFVYIYVDETTTRKIELATATLSAPVAIKDIAAEKTVSVTPSWERKTVFTFDAKANYDRKEITAALYTIMGYQSDTKLIDEYTPTRDTRVGFKVFLQSDTTIKVESIEVVKGNGTEETILKNINYGNLYSPKTVSTDTLEGKKVYATAYTLEQIETPPTPPTPPDDPDPVTNAELIAALNTKCSTAIINRCLSGLDNINLNNVSDTTWYVSKDSNEKIISAEYSFVYKVEGSTDAFFNVGKVEFASPISDQDLKNENIGDTTNTRCYRENYNYTIQANRASLTNAICDKVFGAKEGATRYIIDKGQTAIDPTLRSASMFTVIEINGNEVKEISISIKHSSTDAGLIVNLGSQGNFYTYEEDSYTIHGEKLTIED